MRVDNMTSSAGKAVPNQFELQCDKYLAFQSYNSMIAAYIYKDDSKVYLDKAKWDYSTTTGKYRNRFLNDSGIDETRQKIKSGEYKVIEDLEGFLDSLN